MVRIGNTTYDDSCKKLSFSDFCKLCETLKKFPDFNEQQKQKALELEYTELTGNRPEFKQAGNQPEKAAKAVVSKGGGEGE